MSSFEITSSRGGLSDWEDKGTPGSFKFGSGLDIRKKKDSISCQQALVDEGLLADSRSPSLSESPSLSISASPSVSESPSPSLTSSSSVSPSASSSSTPSASISSSPSTTPSASASPSSSASPSTAPTSVFEDLIHFFVKCSDGYTYGFGNAGRIYRRDADAAWEKMYTDPDGAIKGAEELPASDGTRWLGWCTDTKVKKKEIPGAHDWSDVATVAQNLQPATWHTMKQVGGATKIANKSFLAMIGYDQSFTNEAVDFIPGTTINTLVERNGRVISSEANAAIDCEYPLAQIGTDGQVIFANMVDTIPAFRFPGGGQVNPGGVCNEVKEVNFFEWEETALSWIDKQTVGNLSLWGVYGAESGKNGIYSYGRKFKNQPVTLNLEYAMDVDEIGAVVTVDGITLASYQDGSDYGVKAVDSTTKATGTWESIDLKAPVKGFSDITVWKYHKFLCAPLPANTSIEYWYRRDKNGAFVQAKTIDGNSSFTTYLGREAVFKIQGEAEIFEDRLVLNPSGNNSPEVYRQKTYFL